MTKERRLAIEMWEQIVRELEKKNRNSEYIAVSNIKADFCRSHNLDWKYDCWFCQYVRRDYRPMKSREDIPGRVNGCQRCPLYKERTDILNADEYENGCNIYKNTLWGQVINDNNVSAAKRIVELLKGGHDESK